MKWIWFYSIPFFHQQRLIAYIYRYAWQVFFNIIDFGACDTDSIQIFRKIFRLFYGGGCMR